MSFGDIKILNNVNQFYKYREIKDNILWLVFIFVRSEIRFIYEYNKIFLL